jgi:7,8-dihydroneopterin aldolase/epimerase/oxygenase
MLSIHLHKVIIHAYHGVYAEEKVLGNDFLVDVSVNYHPSKYPVTTIENTIDYVALYDLVKKRMSIATPLLETVASEIALEILAQFSLSVTVNIAIKKLHPPIPAFQGSTGVSLIIHRKDIQ